MSRYFGCLLCVVAVLGLCGVAQADLQTYYNFDAGTGTTVTNQGAGGATVNGTFGTFSIGGGTSTAVQWNTANALFGADCIQLSGNSTVGAVYGSGGVAGCDYVNVPAVTANGLENTGSAVVSVWVKYVGVQPAVISTGSNTINMYGAYFGRKGSPSWATPALGLNYNSTAPGDPNYSGIRATVGATATNQGPGWNGGPNGTAADLAASVSYGFPQNGSGLTADGTPFTAVGSQWTNLIMQVKPDGSTYDYTFYQNGVKLRTVTGLNLTVTDGTPYTLGAYFGGATAGGMNGYIDDFGIFSTSLATASASGNDGKIRSIYNAENVLGTAYNLGVMNSLFKMYDAGTGTTPVGTLTWTPVTSGLTGAAGSVGFDAANSRDYIVFDSTLGSGVVASVPTPEPGTLALLAAGLAGLLAYAWRKRR